MSASFDAYKIFYYVGKYRNITHAASSLFLSQSTVSRTIQSLEAEVGCKLFARTQYGVALTSEGEVLYSHVSRACEQIFIGEEKLTHMQQLSQGGIRVGVSEFHFNHFILPFIKDFRKEYPNVQIDIVTSEIKSQESIIAALDSGRIDIACSAAPFPDSISVPLKIAKCAEYSDIVVAGSGLMELKKGSHTLSELSSYPFITLTGDNGSLSFLDKLLLGNGVSVNSVFRVDTASLLLKAVRACQCLAVVPSLCRSEFASVGHIFEVQMDEPMPTHSISIISSGTNSQSPAREAFTRQLKKIIKVKTEEASTATSARRG